MPVRFAPPCDGCGSLYVVGSSTICGRCMRVKRKRKRRWRGVPWLRCDCGKPAIAVLLVWVGYFHDNLSEERLPVCRACLEIEKETQARLDDLV